MPHQPTSTSARRTGLAIALALLPVSMTPADDTPGWLTATTPRPFMFPADHHAHPGFRTEWWYFTGNLESPSNERIGYQFTLFRQGMSPPGARRADSAWAVDDVGFGHAALSLPERSVFSFAQKLERGSFGSASFPAPATAGGLLACVGGWQVSRDDADNFSIRAVGGDIAIDLRAKPLVPPLAQGDRGLSRKGDGPGNSSFYYSIPRLETTGTLTIQGKSHVVRGLSWLDREWSSSALSPEQIGWDWFALHFDDGRDLMVYQMRRTDGRSDPHNHGMLRHPDGRVVALDAAALRLTPTGHWRSPASGAIYPTSWTLAIPAHGIDLRVRAAQANQELTLQPVTYYEGAVDAITRDGTPVARGYLEMTGYAAPLAVMRSR